MSPHKHPAIILVNPQMGENIGAAARAMLNCGLEDLSLVNPRDGWPSEKAVAMSSGAIDVMPPVQVFDTTAEALAEYQYVYATTARPRDMVKTVFTPKGAALDMKERILAGQQIAFVFGAERSGLSDDDVSLANAIIQIPLNPEFSSLNLGQAVLLVAYEYFQVMADVPDEILPMGDSFPATHKTMHEFLSRLESELEAHNFFRSPDMRPTIVRNLKNLFERADMTEQEVRTFHGILTALTKA